MNLHVRELIAVALLCPLLLAAGDQPIADEYEIKAAMLLNLTKFVDWPAAKLGEPGAPFIIGILGHDPFGHDLDKQLAGKALAGHPIVIERLSAGGHPELCHVLFATRAERRRLEELGAALAHASVLTVGDGEHFAAAGSVFGLVLRGDRVQIEVNLEAARRSNLVVSSRLLKIAAVVSEGH